MITNNTENRTFQNVLREILQRQHQRNKMLFTEQDTSKCKVGFDVMTTLQEHTHEITHAILERATAIAMDRTGCKTMAEMKQARVELQASDVEQAWGLLIIERAPK
jgi:hypothetical protein